jgi:hypothetical protein
MSAVGTIPDNEDKRPPDIIADRQIQRAAIDPGTFAETPRPPLPQLPIASPPNIEDVVRDVATTTFRDLAKTITINGQSPEVSGASISFEIPTQPAASVQFASLNPPPAPPPVVPVVPPPQAGGITTLQEMEASSAARNAPKTFRQRNEEDMDEMVARKIKADPDYTPSKLASNEEKEAFERAKNPAANPSGFSPTALTPQLQQQLVASVTVGAAGVNFLAATGEDFDYDKNKPKFGLEKNRLKGETKFEQEDREEEEYRQQKKEYRDKVRALEEDQPGKRGGEGDKKYTERTNEARLDTMNKEQTAAVHNGDSSYFYKGFIPILFTRKDGQRKILARLDNTHSVVIEGATGNERQGTLPPENGYYEAGGGGGSSCVGLQLFSKTVGTPPSTTTQVWISPGTVAGQVPTGFDPSDGKSISSSGSGEVWAEVNIGATTGEVVSVAVSGGSETPTNTSTSFYYALGYYAYDEGVPTISNYGCGGVEITVCRNWYAAEAPWYGATLSRS